ncbi:uncharacterized protein LOC108100972 [Drosophila ficusphila]|uniref:uncharacterized protein LOC108100972 n=1 Tax=Drosophila ficusphila TaxID=30025 RepID=UPI0007E8176C|nr:uncharacterized protein LOC108100972 [Drosophila ficusphila]
MCFRRLNAFLFLWTFSVSWGVNLESRVESFNTLEGLEETLFIFNFRLLGRDRLLNGTFVHLVDLDDSFEIWLNIQKFKNGRWIQGNINVKTTACDWFTNFFGKYFLPLVKDSNVPPANELCPFRKGEYYLKNVVIDPRNWPPILPRGLSQFNVSYVRNGKSYGGFQFVIDIEEE